MLADEYLLTIDKQKVVVVSAAIIYIRRDRVCSGLFWDTSSKKGDLVGEFIDLFLHVTLTGDWQRRFSTGSEWTSLMRGKFMGRRCLRNRIQWVSRYSGEGRDIGSRSEKNRSSTRRDRYSRWVLRLRRELKRCILFTRKDNICLYNVVGYLFEHFQFQYVVLLSLVNDH